MIYPLFTYAALTKAQKAALALKRGGIMASVIRAPGVLGAEGCAYAVRALTDDTEGAMRLLRAAGASPRRLYYPDEGSDRWRRTS